MYFFISFDVTKNAGDDKMYQYSDGNSMMSSLKLCGWPDKVAGLKSVGFGA